MNSAVSHKDLKWGHVTKILQTVLIYDWLVMNAEEHLTSRGNDVIKVIAYSSSSRDVVTWPICNTYLADQVPGCLSVNKCQRSDVHSPQHTRADGEKVECETISNTIYDYPRSLWLCASLLISLRQKVAQLRMQWRVFRPLHQTQIAYKYKNKNLAIANRSRVSCAHNTTRASIGLNITP